MHNGFRDVYDVSDCLQRTVEKFFDVDEMENTEFVKWHIERASINKDDDDGNGYYARPKRPFNDDDYYNYYERYREMAEEYRENQDNDVYQSSPWLENVGMVDVENGGGYYGKGGPVSTPDMFKRWHLKSKLDPNTNHDRFEKMREKLFDENFEAYKNDTMKACAILYQAPPADINNTAYFDEDFINGGTGGNGRGFGKGYGKGGYGGGFGKGGY